MGNITINSVARQTDIHPSAVEDPEEGGMREMHLATGIQQIFARENTASYCASLELCLANCYNQE